MPGSAVRIRPQLLPSLRCGNTSGFALRVESAPSYCPKPRARLEWRGSLLPATRQVRPEISRPTTHFSSPHPSRGSPDTGLCHGGPHNSGAPQGPRTGLWRSGSRRPSGCTRHTPAAIRGSATSRRAAQLESLAVNSSIIPSYCFRIRGNGLYSSSAPNGVPAAPDCSETNLNL